MTASSGMTIGYSFKHFQKPVGRCSMSSSKSFGVSK